MESLNARLTTKLHAMKVLATQPNLTEQVRKAIVSEIASGKLKAGERIIQENIAQVLGVSRQPVQQALMLLKNHGVLRDAAGRGLIVTSLDPKQVRLMYDIRAVIEGLAFRKAAENNPLRAKKLGPALIQNGRKSVKSGSVAQMIAADIKFHDFIYALSENPLIAPSMEVQWTNTQRVMGEVLMRDETPRDIWDQHEALLHAVTAGDAAAAENLARQHITQAANFMIERLHLREPDRPSAQTDQQ